MPLLSGLGAVHISSADGQHAAGAHRTRVSAEMATAPPWLSENVEEHRDGQTGRFRQNFCTGDMCRNRGAPIPPSRPERTTISSNCSKRLIVRNDDLLVVDHGPRLQTPGACAWTLHSVLADGTAVADLERPAEDELIVGFLPGSADDADIRGRIAAWAELVGFHRLWFPDEIVSLDPPARELGSAHVECLGCGAAFRDGSADFWALVRRYKLFPSFCLVCGLQLPQWNHHQPTVLSALACGERATV